jgi:DNA-directed RNA polymerase III subunit RPC6
MASGSAPQAMDISALKTALYDACSHLARQQVLNQTILFGLGIIPNDDIHTLLTVTQALVDEKLFKVVHSEGLGWKLRSQEDARKSVVQSPHSLHF